MTGGPSFMESIASISRTINIHASTRKVEVDNRISLPFYYRIAANLLKQASIYRAEKNLIDLYIILLRFSSLMSETIPFHRDYQILFPNQRVSFKKKLLEAMNELELLKPEVQRQVHEVNNDHMFLPDSSVTETKFPQYASSKFTQVGQTFQKPSLSLPLPKEETLNRHSILGPSGLGGQWHGPGHGVKVNYPCNLDLSPTRISSMSQGESCDFAAKDAADLATARSPMDLVLSLDDGRWSNPSKGSFSLSTNAMSGVDTQLDIGREPPPPPTLAQVQSNVLPIVPSKVADPRPGPSQHVMHESKAYQHLHLPPQMMEEFLKLALANTVKNLETCGVLAGSLKNRKFNITTLIIPKQESTSDSCQTTNEEEIFNVQDKLSLFPLGWIHTHPTQTCFMSSIDLHTHYSYQVMLPEAIAIVMAPTDTSRRHGIFNLSDPGGISAIRDCEQRGFHPHEELSDGSPIYEHCSHVYMNPSLKFEVVDLR